MANLASAVLMRSLGRKEEKESRAKVLIEVHDAGVQGVHAGAHLAVGDGRANRAEIRNIEALHDLRKNIKQEVGNRLESRNKKGMKSLILLIFSLIQISHCYLSNDLNIRNLGPKSYRNNNNIISQNPSRHPLASKPSSYLLSSLSSSTSTDSSNNPPLAFASSLSYNPSLPEALQSSLLQALKDLPDNLPNDKVDLAIVSVSSVYDATSSMSIVVPTIVEAARGKVRGGLWRGGEGRGKFCSNDGDNPQLYKVYDMRRAFRRHAQ